ncbi:hypothetical protein NP233_g11086 [Leucocoprinus birnbaumii]|uniref:Cytochrome P450 n=1 Tax=Leucocoprinus birnbaumii TaxID=56174 RepID=A0AAD5VJJ3_9AGAR|nr:hypothetical protein NP233_g11086 [Leucocoprinus birnbaumii]
MLVSLFTKLLLTVGCYYFLRLIFNRVILKSPFDDLPGPPSNSWLLGNIPQLFQPKGWGFHDEILRKYGRAIKMRGALGERLFLTFDPRALHHILVKARCLVHKVVLETDPHLISRLGSINALFFGEGLLSTFGQQHKKQRKILNPVFSINHMRDMIPVFHEVTGRLQMVLRKKVENEPQEIDLLHWITRTAVELIGRSGMDYSFDPLVDDTDQHPYSRSVKKLAVLVGGPAGFLAGQYILPFAEKFNCPRIKRFIVEQIPLKPVQDLIQVTDIIHQTSLEIIKTKQDAMTSPYPEIVAEMANKKDIISILMRANAQLSEQDRMSDAEVIGQVSTLVFAAMDTTSSALSRSLYLLATHPGVQERLRTEIKEAQIDGQLSYDQLVSLPYMDAVCRETLRLYPPIPLAPLRTAQKDMILPLSKPIRDANGRELAEIFIPKGTDIVVSIVGSNCNPELWGADAHEWKPDRWLDSLPRTLEEAHMPGIYSHLMTFLGGARACIGFKFAQLEMKVVLSVLLASFKFSPSEKEIVWPMSGIVGPAIEGPDGAVHQKLPLIMSRLH